MRHSDSIDLQGSPVEEGDENQSNTEDAFSEADEDMNKSPFRRRPGIRASPSSSQRRRS